MASLAHKMTVWIRGPWWDGFWILSGVPLGATLTAIEFWFGVPGYVMILWIVLLTQTGHLLSPMALAWSHDGFRANMLRRPVKFVALPIAVLACSTVAGLVGSWTLPVLRFDPINFAIAAGPTTWVQFRNPFMSLVALYAAWNTYHFGKQAFGVMSIYRRKNDLLLSKSSGHYSSAFGHKDARDRTFGSDIYANDAKQTCCTSKVRHFTQRRIDLFYCCSVVWLAMAMPFIPRIAEEVHYLTGSPAQPHPFLDYVRPVYLGIALCLILLMILNESKGASERSDRPFEGSSSHIRSILACFGKIQPPPSSDQDIRRLPGVVGTRSRRLVDRITPRALFILTDGLGLILIFHAGLWGFAIIGMNHWMVAIGLASHVHANQRGSSSAAPFVLGLMVAGAVLFSLLFVNLAALGHGFSGAALQFSTVIVGLRLGLGFVHFLYDRWLYKFSDPEARATIGGDVFLPRHSPLRFET